MKTHSHRFFFLLLTSWLLSACVWSLPQYDSNGSTSKKSSSFDSRSSSETSLVPSFSTKEKPSSYSSSDSSSISSDSFSNASSSLLEESSSSVDSKEAIEPVSYRTVDNQTWPQGKKTYRVKPTRANGDSVTVYDVRYSTKGYLAYPTTLTIHKTDYCLTYETVALYYLAFRTFPPNYLSIKNKKQVTKNTDLRCVSTYYKGTSHTYDYTKALGTFQNEINGTYYEFDIALSSSYSGSNRGAGRLVVVEEGLTSYQGDGPVCFYTKDHYADFCEFYNFAGGWSEEFAGVYNKSGSYTNSPEVDLPRPIPTTITPTYLSLS